MNLDSFSWPAKRASIRDDTSKARQVDARLWHQGGEPGDEVERLEDDMGVAVTVRRLDLVAEVAVRRE
jgi:hypothetical protein